MVGEGLSRVEGPALLLRYRIRLPTESGGHVLDWIYLAPSGTIVNRTQFRKFGIKMTEMVATMRRKEPA